MNYQLQLFPVNEAPQPVLRVAEVIACFPEISLSKSDIGCQVKCFYSLNDKHPLIGEYRGYDEDFKCELVLVGSRLYYCWNSKYRFEKIKKL
ncbi:MAG: hypothetical protein Q8T08_07175 [Ignavibacteria bacterium]|nr:hypothetical protein [Ignavibacteria bacterium]